MSVHFVTPGRLALLAGVVAVVGGCVAHVRARPFSAGYVVYEAPPAARVVVQPAAPIAGAVWVEGQWQWNGAQWVWSDGYWEQPRQGYVYVQPRWERRGRGWVHVRGAWHPHRGQVYVAPAPRPVEVRPAPAPAAVEVRPARGGVRVRGSVEVR